MPYTADNVPSHVPRTQADRWAATWNRVYDQEMSDGDASRDEAEGRAFRVANGLLSKRSVSLSPEDYVIFTGENGGRQRGQVDALIPADSHAGDGETKETNGLSLENAEPLVKIRKFKPTRDGWEVTEDYATVKLSDCEKTEMLPPPSRVPRKADQGVEVNDEFVKSVVAIAVREAIKAMRSQVTVDAPHQIKRLGPDRIGGYALVHGTPQERDIEGDFFTKSTDLWLDVYNNQPIMFDHAVGLKLPDDPALSDDEQDTPRRYKLGRIVKSARDDIGLWIEAVVDAHNDWVEGVWELVDKGALFFSSGSVPHLIKRTEGGEVKSWPIVEVSLTPTPAEPRRTRVAALSNAQTATEAASGGNQRMPEGSEKRNNGTSVQKGEQSPAPTTKATTTGGLPDMKDAIKRINHLLAANDSDELHDAVAHYKAARQSLKQATDDGSSAAISEQAAQVADAASQLEQLVAPIADQAKSAFGLDPDEFKTMLIKQALLKYAPDDPLDAGAEDYTEDGDPELDDQQDPYMMADDLDPEDDYLEDGDPLLEEDEEPAMLSARPPRRSTVRATRSASLMTQADVTRTVRREMDRLPRRSRGSYKSGGGVPSIIVRKERTVENSISKFIKASKMRDQGLNRLQLKSQSSYKALGINPDTSGGYLVPPDQANEVIELLRAKSIFMQPQGGGEAPGKSLVTTLPLNRDTLLIPKQTGAGTAYWTAENAALQASTQTLAQIQLIAKKLSMLTYVSNELLEDATEDVDEFIRSDIAETMAREVDRAILYGQGIGNEPRGVDSNPDISKTALNRAPKYGDLTSLVNTVEEANVPEDDSWRWLLRPRDKNLFRLIEDGSGNFIFSQNTINVMPGGVPEVLLGYPWMTSTTVDLTGGETDVFFGRWKDLILGMRKTIEIVATDVGAGTFESDQTAVRAILRMDVALRHAESIAMLTDVRAVTEA
jgi:HK97 family phage major capsid protein